MVNDAMSYITQTQKNGENRTCIYDRGQTNTQTDRQTHSLQYSALPIGGGVINRVGGQAVQKLRLETDRQTDTTDRNTFLVNAVTIKWSDEAVG